MEGSSSTRVDKSRFMSLMVYGNVADDESAGQDELVEIQRQFRQAL